LLGVVVEKELKKAVSAFRKVLKSIDAKADDKKRLTSALDDLMDLMDSPGDKEAKRVTAQPLPTGQIPDENAGKFSATN
jgi:hypothetical protein